MPITMPMPMPMPLPMQRNLENERTMGSTFFAVYNNAALVADRRSRMRISGVWLQLCTSPAASRPFMGGARS